VLQFVDLDRIGWGKGETSSEKLHFSRDLDISYFSLGHSGKIAINWEIIFC